MTTAFLPKKLPWETPDYDEDAIYAIRALAQGVANSAQQATAWRYMMYITGATEEFADLSFRPDALGGERATAFAEGKRFVGMMLRKLFRPELTPAASEFGKEQDPVPTRRRATTTAPKQPAKSNRRGRK